MEAQVFTSEPMQTNTIHEYQRALARRIRMRAEFIEKFGRPPGDHEIGTMPLPPVELVEGFKSGELEYQSPKTDEYIRMEYANEDARRKTLRRKRRVMEIQRAERERIERMKGNT